MLGCRPGRSAKTVLLFTFYLLLISLFTHITSALITYDKGTLLDIGNRFTNLVQDTLSPNPSWPLEQRPQETEQETPWKKRWYSQQTEEKGSQSSFTEYPVQLEDRIHWIIATLSLRMPTKPAHYRLLANRTMPAFSSHRNINKGSHRNPR